MTNDLLDRLRAVRVVPVIVLEDAAGAAPLARALAEGGLPCAEVTFRTPAAAETLRRMADAVPGMLLGAGTVRTPAQAAEARDAGAAFVVAPGINPAVVDWCLEQGVPVCPGVCTPTEIEAALDRGLRLLKFFPAEAMGGLPLLRALSAPYGEVRWMPTGGVTRANVRDYLAFAPVAACGGSWMAPAEWLRGGHFGRVRDEAAATVAALAGGAP